MRAAKEVCRSFWEGLKPDPIGTIDEWAAEHRVLSKESSKEYGRWDNSRTPYLVEPMRCLSVTSRVQTVVLIFGAQVGKTETGNNFVGYIVDRGLGPVLVVQKTDLLAKRYSKQRLRPMFRDTPTLRGKVSDASKRDGKNNLLYMEFSGGHLIVVNAEAAGGLRSMPIRFIFGDEIDSYPGDVEGEGDPCDLAEQRSNTFSTKKKILWVSTPTDEETSKINKKYKKGDMCQFHVPCPFCSFYQPLEWGNVDFKRDREGELVPGSVTYICSECKEHIQEWQKTQMLERGRWVAQRNEPTGLVRSFHLNSLYSPVGWKSWEDVAREFVEADNLKDENKLKTWVNTALAETWKNRGEKPKWERLYNRREDYKIGVVPRGAVFLTLSADIQKDRIEWEVIGWGPRHESWSVEWGVIEKDISKDPWHDDMDAVLLKEWPTEDGLGLRIRKAAIDSGYMAHHVYKYTRTRLVCIAVKGRDTFPAIIGPATKQDINSKGGKMRRGVKLHLVGTNLSKTELYGWLRLDANTDGTFPAGYRHFPQYSEEYFKQLTAEQRVKKKDARGRVKYVWDTIRERNEKLDLWVYARAAASLVGLDRWTKERWEEERQALGAPLRAKPQKRRKRRTMHGGESWLGQ